MTPLQKKIIAELRACTALLLREQVITEKQTIELLSNISRKAENLTAQHMRQQLKHYTQN